MTEQTLDPKDFPGTVETIVSGTPNSYQCCPTSTGSYEFIEGDPSPKYFIPSSVA